MTRKTDFIRRDHRHVTDDVVDKTTGEPPASSGGGGGTRWIGPVPWSFEDYGDIGDGEMGIALPITFAQGDLVLGGTLLIESTVNGVSSMLIAAGTPGEANVMTIDVDQLTGAQNSSAGSKRMRWGIFGTTAVPRVMYVDDPDVFQVWIAPTDPPESGSGQAFIFVATPEAPE